ncbi:MAG: hypothetical protein JNM00_15595 [Flavobacteriales bacterium]|nr:hypothetical protein [Flavobacteriales bacterium]
MANKKSDSLFRLVHSLTKAEKRYFRIFSSRHIIGDNNSYMVLFDAIEKQKAFDEDALIKSLKKHAFSNRISITKNRLYNAILRSLDSFYTASDPEFQARRLVESASILYRKGLYDQSKKVLVSAEKLARRQKLNNILLDICAWEQKLAEKNNYEDITAAAVKDIYSRGKQAMSELGSNIEWWNLKSTLFMELYRGGKMHNEENLIALRERVESLPPQSEIGGMSPTNRFLYHQVHSAWHFARGNYEACYPHLVENLTLVNKNRSFFKSEPGLYISLLANTIYTGARCGQMTDAGARLHELRRLTNAESARSAQQAVNMFAIRVSTELVLLLARNEAVPAAQLAEIEHELKTFDARLSQVRKAQLYFNLAALHLVSARAHDALRYIHKLVNTLESNKAADIYAMAHLLGLVVHIDLGNYDLLHYNMRSVKRLLLAKNRLGKFEEVLLEFAAQSMRKRKPSDESAMYGKFIEDLTHLKASEGAQAFEYFDFIAWAKKKQAGSMMKAA